MKKTELTVLLFLLTCSVASGSPFQHGHKHYFTYSASSHVLGLHNLTTIIKFHVLPVNSTEDGSLNLLKLDSFVQRSSRGYVESNPRHWNLSRSFLFQVTGSGVVSKIYHHPDEEHEVLTLKKLLAGTMSMYKKRSYLESWKYEGWETDQHGRLLHSYTGKRVADGTSFTRQHNSSEHVHRLHEKTINYNHEGLITSVTGKDTIRLRNQPGTPQSVKKEENVVIIGKEGGDFPTITSTSDNSLKLTARRRFASPSNEDFSHLKLDSPEVRKAPRKEQQLKEVELNLKGLLACIKSYPDKYAANRTQCVHELTRLYNNLTREDRHTLTLRHLARCRAEDKACEDERSLFLDILCGRGDEDSQRLVLNHILHDTRHTEDEIRTVLYHYINLKTPIQETVDAVEDLCFRDDYRMTHTEELGDNQMRACLTLGGLVKWMSANGNYTLAERVVDKLEQKLGMYNHTLSMPIVNRGKRSIYDVDKEQHHHILNKMVFLHSLGNAGMSRSLRHIRSYLQPNKGSSAWRRAAANSLRFFKCNESALALFDVLAHDENEKVHKEAREVYLKHPRRKDNMKEKEALVLSRHYDYVTVTRVKRSVGEFLMEILDDHGFHMLIKAPGLDWSKTIGTKNIGANVGIRLINTLELKLHPLNSFFKVDIDNQAWIHADVGMINAHVDIARAKFCFVGHIEYDLNVLKEFGIDYFKNLLNQLKDVIHKITDDVQEAMKLFKKITSPSFIKNLFTTFIDFVKNLPNIALQFVNDFVKLVKKVIHYHADPIIEKVKQIGMRIKAFAEEVKQSALEFYHSIADAVMITLPNVGKMLKEAGDDIIRVFKDFFKSPTQSFSKLEQVVIRVQLAVSMVIDAKNRIVDACFFTKGTNPLWMRLSDDISVIISDIKDLVDMVMRKVNGVLHPHDQQGALPGPDNNGIMGPYDMKSWFHEEAQVMLSNVTTSMSGMRTAADPFFQTFREVMTLIQDVKTAYEIVTTVIHAGKSVIQRLFGGKFHKKFPSEKEAGHCTEAVWPSNAKGKFKTFGVDVAALVGHTIVNPVSGVVKVSEQNEITILPNDRHFRKYVIIINNVSPMSNVTSKGKLVEAGTPIGTAGNMNCDTNFIHVAMYVRGTNNSVDPTKYFARKIPLPKWITECNERSLTILGMTHELGRNSGNPKDEPDNYKSKHYSAMTQQATIPHHIEPPFKPDGIDSPQSQSLGNAFKDKLSPLKDLGAMMMSLKSKIPHIEDVFNIKTMTVTTLKDTLKSKPDMVKQLDDLVSGVAACIKDVPVVNPAGMSLFKLRSLTQFFKLNGTGDRLAMVNALRRNALKDCPNLNTSVSYEFGHYCTPHFDCQGMTCGTVFSYAQYVKTLKMDIRRCGQNITFGLPNQTVSIDIHGGHQTFDAMLPDPLMDGIYVNFHVEPEMENGEAKISLSGALCASNFGTCLPQVSVLDDARFADKGCTGSTGDPFLDRINAMPVRRLMTKISQCHLDMSKALTLMNNIREALLNQLFDSFNGNIESFLEEFSEKKDSCIRIPIPPFVKDKTFFKLNAHFMVGPIPMGLEFGAGGSTGTRMELDACFMSMTIKGQIIPQGSLKVWGFLDIDIGIAFGGLELTGYIMQISFPVAGSIGFSKFPLDVGFTLDMVLVPLTLDLSAFAKLRLLFFTKTVYRGSLWKYQSKSIKKNILDLKHKGSDTSPPSFSKNAVGPREKRSAVGGGCEVRQIEGRDPTDTAFLLEVTANDDVSDVKTFYAIGTHDGGTDVLSWTEMAGNSLTAPMKLPNGVPLFWTIKARNSEGVEALTQCMLHTYDNTPPDGRVDEDFRISSNPFQLGGTVVVLEDSNVDPKQQIALGLSTGGHGNELDPWSSILLERTTERSDETTALRYFSLPKLGTLSAEPIKSLKTQFDVDCAKACVSHGQNCVSFDFDYSSQMCDFHDVGEGPSAQLRQHGSYKSFERLGFGQKHYKLYKNLNLTHGETYFINTAVVNELGYKSFLSSHGTLVDLTPPCPGPVGKVKMDTMKSGGCSASILQRCTDISDLPNHRVIIDGDGSNTVFNGHKPLNDEQYTLSNNLIAGNWDGFHDNETDIFGYTWAAGTQQCIDDIVSFNDPHANLPSKDDWTYSGLTSGLALKDGPYHITVQAVNNIVHGGALVTTVCHSVPLIVDTTPPIFNSIDEVFFDEDFELLGLYYNGSDPLSKIAHVHFGLGHTKNDVEIRGYKEYESYGNSTPYILIENFELQQGEPAWPRLRLTNNVGLTTSGHAQKPLIVDDSPPVSGIVNDGNVFNADVQYQSDDKNICAQWQNFYDSESGIKSYMWGVGTVPGKDDIVKFKMEDRTVHKDCFTIGLHHNTTYYSTVIAYNAALNQKKTNKTSDGVLVDTTDPLKGWIKDGSMSDTDMSYSSDQALIQAIWGGFSDPESGISRYEVEIFINDQLRKTNTFEHDTTTMSEKTLELKQGDRIHVKITAFNGAGKSVDETSDGFIIDLTPPIVDYVYDNPGNLEYQTNKTTLHLSWKFEDHESGLDRYLLTVMQDFQGMKKPVWPSSESSATLQATGTTMSHIVTGLNLIDGARYFAHVVAINKAKMSKTADSTGVSIDSTPPTMNMLHIGPLKEDEEIKDGKIIHMDKSKMTVSWRASDPESDISRIFIAIGTNATDQSITHGFITVRGVHEITLKDLNMVDTKTSGNYYYVQIKAENGAGVDSSILVSKPVEVLPGNVPGIIYDGRKRFEDADYSHDKSTFAMSFAGFQSVACGIVAYEWGIGTEPFVTDIVGFTGFGIVKTNQSSGFGQMDIQLFEGVKYFTTVRARTGHKCYEDHIVASSDGITVDTQGPTIKASNKKGHIIPDVTSWGVIFQNETDIVEIVPNVMDPAGINSSVLCIGSYPYEGNIHSCQPHRDQTIKGLSIQPGSSVFITVQAQDHAQNNATWESLALIPDTTPPEVVNLTCTSEISSAKTEVECSWDQVNEHESHLKSINLCVGLTDKPCNITAKEDVALERRKWKVDLFRVLDGVSDPRIFVTMLVKNVMNNEIVFTREVKVDKTAPAAGRVWIVTKDELNSTTESKACQVAQTYVEVFVTGFEDSETGIDRCQVGLGREPGTTNIRGFNNIKPDTVTLFGQLSLRPGDQVYATATCQNKAGLSSRVTSDPVVISPRPVLTVQDGEGQTDEDYQSQLSTLQGSWEYSDGCPVTRVEWQIMTVSWKKFQDFTLVTGTKNKFYSDELHLTAGVTYINAIRVTDAIGRVHVAYSDGITVSIEPPHPGAVRDGEDRDVDYQTATTDLSVNWDEFGMVNSSDATQQIERYEVAIGDDVRNPDSRSNVLSFQDVKLQRAYTFTNLTLTPKKVTYYVTVRAYSKAGSFQEAYTDGIKVGFDLDVAPGLIEVHRYTNSLDKLTVSWSKFYSDIGITKYSIGLTKDMIAMPNITTPCSEIQAITAKHNLTLTETTNSLEILTNLHLVQGETYYVAVIAHDKADSCRSANLGHTTVDVTPPKSGDVKVEGGRGRSIMFVKHKDQVTIRWAGFEDKESGIQLYRVVLSSKLPCGNGMEHIIKTIDVKNETTGTMYKLNLEVGSMYTVQVTAVNQAGRNTSVKGLPFLVDTTAPVPGTVKLGTNWKSSIYFQKEQTQVTTLTGLARNPKHKECKKSKQVFPQARTNHSWTVMENVNTNAVLVDGHYARVALTYDDKLKNLIAGGLAMTLGESIHAGNYTFRLMAAQGRNIITSFHISFGELSEYHRPNIAPLDTTDVDDEIQLSNVTDANATYSNDTDVTEDDCLSNPGIALFFYGSQDENLEWKARVCVRDDSKAKSKWFDLPGDPSQYIYNTDIKFTKNVDGIKRTWKVEIFTEGHQVAGIDGYIFSGQPNIIYRVQPLDGYVPPIGDPLHPYFSQAILSHLSVPDTTDKDCLHGDAFYDGESGIKEIWVGISSNKSLVDDIVPFTLKSSFCLPCTGSCSEICDANCSVTNIPDFSVLKLQLNNIHLGHSERGSQNNTNSSEMMSFKAPTYYVNVKAVNFANQSTISSSNAFQVDITPPTFKYMMCVDPTHSLDEPSDYIGSNRSIGAFWDCDEDVGEIAKYMVEIGSTDGGNDILKATSVDLKKKVGLTLEHMELSDGKVYFLTATAINSAGLSTKASCNATVMLGGPGTSRMYTQPMFISSYTASTKIPLSDSENSIGLEVHGASHIFYYEWMVGTKPSKDDVFPVIKVATRSSTAKMSVQQGQLWLDGRQSNISLSDYHNDTEEDDGGLNDKTFLNLEPGRCFYHSLHAVGQSHLASEIATQPLCIKRAKDVIAEVHLSIEEIQMNISQTYQGHGLTTTSHMNGQLSIRLNGYNGSMLIGTLNNSDTSQLYGSAATADYVPYITDPEDTMQATSRLLRGRLVRYTGLSFFMSPATSAYLTDNVTVAFSANTLLDANGTKIELLQWNADKLEWEMPCSRDTSADTSQYKICLSGPSTTIGRSTYIQITEPQHFSLFEIKKDVYNTAPIFVTKSLAANEDNQIKGFIEVVDKEEDALTFTLLVPSVHGKMSLSPDGYLTYQPEENFCGVDLVTVEVTEQGVPPGTKQNKIHQDVIINVQCEDDPPDLTFITTGNTMYEADVVDTVEVVLEVATSSANKHMLGYFALSDIDASDELSLLFDSDAANDVGLELKNMTSEAYTKQGHIKPSRKKSYTFYEVWLNPPTASTHNRTIIFRGKDRKTFHSNPMSLRVNIRHGTCQGSACGGVKIKGVKRDKSKLFQDLTDGSSVNTPPPGIFRQDYIGKGLATITTSPSSSNTVVLATDGVFSKGQDTDKSDREHVVLKVSGKLNISAEALTSIGSLTNNITHDLTTEKDMKERLLQQQGLPFTLSMASTDIATSLVDVKVRNEDNTTTIIMLVKETDGVWREIPTICNNSKPGLLEEDQSIITMCPELFSALSKRVKTTGGKLSTEVVLFSVKKKPQNHYPVLLDKVISIKEEEQLYVQLHAMDPEGDAFVFHVAQNAEHGYADVDSTGNIFYTPSSHYSGEDRVHIQLKETKVLDGSPPKVTDAVLLITIKPVNDPPILYFLPPNSGEFRVETHSKIEMDVVRPTPYKSSIVELGYVAAADWDVGDTITHQIVPLNKTEHHFFDIRPTILPEDVWLIKLSDIRRLPEKKVSQISIHFLSEFTGTLVYQVKIKDKAGAGVELDLSINVSFKACQSSSIGCIDHVTAKLIN